MNGRVKILYTKTYESAIFYKQSSHYGKNSNNEYI